MLHKGGGTVVSGAVVSVGRGAVSKDRDCSCDLPRSFGVGSFNMRFIPLILNKQPAVRALRNVKITVRWKVPSSFLSLPRSKNEQKDAGGGCDDRGSCSAPGK